MNDQTDSQLLRAYAESRSDTAFTELVRRHVDFVHSAARRMVCDSHLAEDVTQGTFVALARSAAQLTNRPVLAGWLHRTTQNIAAQTVRTEVRRRAREQEAAIMNELLAPDVSWNHIAPQLDAALGELAEVDRDALLLRYFERKSAQEMAQILGISDEAAQKRVNRAVERLRKYFARREVSIGASALVVLISANAVQTAPAGLVAAISATVALTGTAVSGSSLIAATKTIFMTTLQKTFVTITVAALAGTSIYEARQAVQLRTQSQTLEQAQAPLTGQIQQLQRERVDTTNRLADLLAENSRLKANPHQAELLKLRGEVGILRRQASDLEKLVQSLHNAEKSNPSPYSTNPISRGAWGFAGYATPEAAVQSMFWAKGAGDVQAFVGSVHPDLTNDVSKSFLGQNSDQERSRFLADQATNWIGLQILNVTTLADDEVMVQATIQEPGNEESRLGHLLILKRINGEWKFVRELGL